jgi:hypothetical protein
MAYSIRFTGIGKDKVERFCIEPDWWDISELGKHVNLKWTVTNETGSYVDKDADISTDEARILHEQFKHRLLEKIAYNSRCVEAEKGRTDQYASSRLAGYMEYVTALKAALQAMDSAVGDGSAGFSHFHVCVFEWDSGL